MAHKQLECRIVVTHWPGEAQFELGMFDPVSMRYEPLGKHPTVNADKIIGDLQTRMEKERHVVTFSEVTGPR